MIQIDHYPGEILRRRILPVNDSHDSLDSPGTPPASVLDDLLGGRIGAAALSPDERTILGPVLTVCVTAYLKTARWDHAMEAARTTTGDQPLPPRPPTAGLAALPGAINEPDDYSVPSVLSVIAKILADLVARDGDERYRAYLIEIFKCAPQSHRGEVLFQLRRLSWKRGQMETSARELFNFINANRDKPFAGECLELLMFGTTMFVAAPLNPLWTHWLLPLLAREPEILNHIKLHNLDINPHYIEKRGTWAEAGRYLAHANEKIRCLTIVLLAYWGYPVQNHRAILLRLTRPEPGNDECSRLALCLIIAADIRPTEEEIMELEALPPPEAGEDIWYPGEREDRRRRYIETLRGFMRLPPPFPDLKVSRRKDRITLRLNAREAQWAPFDEGRIVVAYKMVLKEGPYRRSYTDRDQFGLFILDIKTRTANHLRLPAEFPIQPTEEWGQKRSFHEDIIVTRDRTVLMAIGTHFSDRRGYGFEIFLFECKPRTRQWWAREPGARNFRLLRARELNSGTGPPAHAATGRLVIRESHDGRLKAAQLQDENMGFTPDLFARAPEPNDPVIQLEVNDAE